MKNTPNSVKCPALMGIFTLILLMILGCETTSTPEDSSQIAPTANLKLKDAIKLAGLLQNQNTELLATLGGGKSMKPLYAEDTIIIISPIAFDDLKKDMIVAYTNKTGIIVVHQLIRKERDGWLVMGTNNEYLDPEKVTPENLKGVVYGVIYTDESMLKR